MINLTFTDVGSLKATDLGDVWSVEVYDTDGKLNTVFENSELKTAWDAALIELDYDLYSNITWETEVE